MVKDLYSTTRKRLERLNVFDKAIVERVAKFAETQDDYDSYQDFFRAMRVGEVTLHKMPSGAGVPVIDIPAKGKEKGVLVMHLTMANGLDENQLYQLATLAGVNPEYRIISFGNPTGGRHYFKEQNLSFKNLFSVAFGKSAKPLVVAELDYLQKQGITSHYQAGYSFGALKSTIEAQNTPKGSLEGLLLIDPVAKPRNIFKLFKDFERSYIPLGKHVNNADLGLYHAARGDAAREAKFRKGLVRSVNVAIAFLLVRTNIFTGIDKVRALHPKTRVALAWGSVSELGDDALTQHETKRLGIVPMRLEGYEHTLANDVHIYAAIVRQFLAK